MAAQVVAAKTSPVVSRMTTAAIVGEIAMVGASDRR